MLKRAIHFIDGQKQLKNLTVYGFGQLFNLVTPLLVIPYIVLTCGEENFGKTAVGMALSFFLMVFIDYGSDLVGVREVSVNRDNKEKLEQIFTTTYFSKLILLIAVLLFTSVLFTSIPYFKSEKQMFFLGLSVLIGQFLNPMWFLQGIENVKWITISNVVSKIIYIAGIFLFIQSKSDYIYINLLWGIGMIISNGIFFLLLIKKYNFSFSKCNKEETRAFLKKDFKMFTSQIFVSIQMYSPVVLISYFGSNLMAGQYKIVDQVIVIFKTYIVLFFNFVFPKVCYLLETDKEKGVLSWKTFNGVNFVFILCSMAAIYFFSYDIVSYFNPANRTELSDLLRIAVFFPVLYAISIPLKQLVLGWNFNRFYVNSTALIVILNIVAIIVLLPFYKVYSVFYSLIASEAIVILFYLICIRKKLFSQQKNS